MNILHIVRRIKKSLSHQPLCGFTLIEAMIGIFIISVSIGGPMVIAGRAAQEIRYSRELFTATFLGQEAIELVRFRRDSVFMECSDPSSAMCLAASSTILSTGVQETPNETAWKVFKNQFGGTSNTYCFSVNGCVFDMYGILKNPNANAIPVDLYDASTSNCSSLNQDRSVQINNITSTSSTDFMYLCNDHTTTKAINTQIRRVVKLTSMGSVCPSYECSYRDDVRVDVTIFYNYRGTQKSIVVTDFIKPRS